MYVVNMLLQMLFVFFVFAFSVVYCKVIRTLLCRKQRHVFAFRITKTNVRMSGSCFYTYLLHRCSSWMDLTRNKWQSPCMSDTDVNIQYCIYFDTGSRVVPFLLAFVGLQWSVIPPTLQ